MGVFSEIAMEQQNSMFDSSAAFEDDEAFELEEMESLPVPPVGTDTVPVSAASVSAGETALADAEEEPADEVAPAGEEKSAEEGNSAQPPAAEDEEKKRAEHEAAEAQRKAEFDAKQQAKKAAEQEQIARLEAMSDEEVIAASTQRVSTDVEKLTRRNMKECVSEHIQMLCMEDTAFARLTMHPKKNMIRCFQYINRNRAMANCGYAVVRGKDPVATGRLGDILAFAKEAPDSESIVQVAVGQIDGVTLLPDVWYGVDLTRRTVN